MAILTINHAITRLLREGIVEGRRNQTLYDALMDNRSDIETHLRHMGMELVVLSDMMIAHARNMSDEKLDALSKAMGCEPISTVCSQRRLSYYDSVAVIFFRMSLDQEVRQGGDEIWIPHSEVIDTLSRNYTDAVSQDKVSLDIRIEQTLKHLHDLSLLSIQSMGKSSRYRGRPLMQAAFSRDAVSDFARQMNQVIDTAEAASDIASKTSPTAAPKRSTPQGRKAFQAVDLDPDISDLALLAS